MIDLNGIEIKALRKTFDFVMWVDSTTSKVPFGAAIKSRLGDTILDTLFGAAEDFDYVSKTAPASPPPTP